MKARNHLPVTTLRGHYESVNALSYKEEGLLSGASDGAVILWDVNRRRPKLTVSAAHARPIQAVQLLKGNRFITSGRDGMIKIWQYDDSASTLTSPLQIFVSECCHFCNTIIIEDGPSHSLLASSDHTDTLLLWDTRQDSSTARISLQGVSKAKLLSERSMKGDQFGMLSHLASSASSSSSPSYQIYAGMENGSLLIADLRKMAYRTGIQKHSQPILAMDVHPQKKDVITGGGDESIFKYHYTVESEEEEDQKVLAIENEVKLVDPGTRCLKYRSDGEIIVAGLWDGTVSIFDDKTMKPLAVLDYHRDSVYAVAFAPVTASQPYLFATAGKDHNIAIWNLFKDSYRLS